MNQKEIICFQCGKVILIKIDNDNNIFYKKKTKSYSKIIKLINVAQEPNIKYFCNQSCKNNYVFTVRSLFWYKNKKGKIKMDKLEKLFELQKAFQYLIGNETPYHKNYVSNPINIKLIKNQILALYDEIGEALREVPWKPWKVNQEFNVSKFKIELIDTFHFLINLFLLSGMEAQEVFDLFVRKNKINVRRQKDGY